MFTFSGRHLAALVIAFISCTASAQTGSDIMTIEEVEVTARRAGGARAVTEAVTSVGADELDEASLQIVTDALRGQPGVFVQQTTPGQGTAIVRGLKGSEVLHLVDGMRLNNALFRNAPNQYLALVDPFIAERLDVVRGPLSTLYGSDAMGGVVQVITDRPFLGGQDQWQSGGRALLRFDSRTLGRVGHLAGAAGRDTLGFGGAISVQDHDDLRAADRRAQSPTAYRSAALSGFVSWRPSDNVRNDLSVQYLEQPSTPRFDELFPGFGQTEAASEEFAFEPNDRLFVHAEHRSGGWSRWLDDVVVHVGWQQVTDGRRTRDTGATATRVEDNRSDLFGLTFGAAMTPGPVHAIQYGIDAYFDTVTSSRTEVSNIDGARTAVASRFPDGSTLRNIDAYIHDDMTLSPSVLVTTGLRVSHAEVDLAGTATSAAANIQNTDITGSIGLRVEVTDRWAVTSNVGRGFRAPNIFDLGTLGARPGNRFNIANPDLEPETVWTADAGLLFNGNRWQFEGVVWFSDYFDQITSVSTGELDEAGRDIVQSQNASEVVLYGVEVATSVAFNEHWSASVNLNSVHGETKFGGGEDEPADRIPPLNAQLSLRYEKSAYWVDVRWRGARNQTRLSARDVSDPRINPLGTPGFGVLDMRGGWQIGDHWHTTIELSNLTDRDYREHGSGINAAGRAVAVTVRADW